ncbi:hypothetical protein [Microcoleus sp. D2_18a_D3]
MSDRTFPRYLGKVRSKYWTKCQQSAVNSQQSTVNSQLLTHD